ncbi:PREDICTED: uncharacterized protein LOC109473298 [Branchiostoma belcheri]|uniref:Uncharacterized protein LOC109473298 n=1 Tax=Branchiostoma belcheri TaxID=7741 RepID=A0A6P4Z470_BRABE|nr:PREDICTED: uncharacterized protein LOC109473298 [Branchiostoma belcheri]
MTTCGGGMHEAKFSRLPFQQLMWLDILIRTITRCKLSEFKVEILMRLKSRLGLDWLTITQAQRIVERFNTRSSGYVVPRRCGKSSFFSTILALILVTCPYAGLKALYTAHTLSVVSEMYQNIATNVVRPLEAFNAYQLHQYQMRKERNNGIESPSDFYFKAEARPYTHGQIIRVEFFKLNDDGVLNLAGEKKLVNSLHCKLCIRPNSLRGLTYNMVIVDEAHFVPANVYETFLPWTATDDGTMVMMSSHKCGQDNNSYVDLNNVRMSGILMNTVGYVCRHHLLSMIRAPHIGVLSCLCNFFSQPLHINTDKDYKKMMIAFTAQRGSSSDTESDHVNNKTAMLSEVGGIPQGLNKDDLVNVDVKKISLANESGTRHFMIQSIPVEAYLCTRTRKDMTFSEDVLCYIDPSPTDVTRSYNAMAFVTVASKPLYLPNSSNRPDGREVMFNKYVVLAHEDYRPRWVDPDNSLDDMTIMAKVFMITVRAITLLYGGHFKRFIVVPESNALAVDTFWSACGMYLAQEEYASVLCPHNVIIVSTVTETRIASGRRPSEKRTERIVRRAKQRHENRFNPYITSESENQLLRSYPQRSYFLDNSLIPLPVNTESYRPQIEMLTQEEIAQNRMCEMDEPPIFKLGYSLGRDKVQRHWDFFTRCYNRNPNNMSDITCARQIFSFWLTCKGESIPSYIARNMAAICLHRSQKATTSWTCSGKDRVSNGKFIRDDPALVVIMATTILADIINGTYVGKFLRLEANTHHSGQK